MNNLLIYHKKFGTHIFRNPVWRSAASRCFSESTEALKCLPKYNKKPDVENTIIVDTKEKAEKVMTILMSLPANTYHAADTEVSDIDVKKQSPVGNGKVICASIYSGPEIDYGGGCSRIWIDNLDEAEGTLDYFKPFFESETQLKVWHNYGFDRHVLYNHNINALGLGGDTMHMARLWDSSRLTRGGYSLEALTTELYKRKVPMKERFGKPRKLKNGEDGKAIVLPDVLELQRFPEYRNNWIDYSAFDAEGTWHLYMALKDRLIEMQWHKSGTTMFDYYNIHMVKFAETLTDMERRGIKVKARDFLPEIEKRAIQDRDGYIAHFKSWARKYCDDAQYMNITSDAQKQQFLFAPASNNIDRKLLDRKKIHSEDVRRLPDEKEFLRLNIEGFIKEGKKKPLKHQPFYLQGLGIPPIKYTAAGWPASSGDVLRELAGKPSADPPVWGSIYKHFLNKGSSEQSGEDACKAIESLLSVSSIDTMLSTFIVPLQSLVDSNSRIHTSMNINTETGRLSSRNPNLQNQPALEKDIYKIRSAFTCEEGNTLLVADYGQLELRVLAHMTNCKSMLEAFRLGGDFHSRTALGMYPYIQESVASKECYLEWDYSKGKPDKPLLKEKFASERRKAKILNFSIAYGKTAFGLAKDFNVTTDEAKATVDLWYADRPEVKQWQDHVIKRACKSGYTRTLMGRYRHLPDIKSKDKARSGHSARAAINTPIQGGAADIVMAAMVKINYNQHLKKLGWKMLLQIHDEVILEGPKESAKEAQRLLLRDMEEPLKSPLLVDLKVDSDIADTWYEAK